MDIMDETHDKAFEKEAGRDILKAAILEKVKLMGKVSVPYLMFKFKWSYAFSKKILDEMGLKPT